MRSKYKLRFSTTSFFKRAWAMVFILLMLHFSWASTIAMALDTGPTQPEVQSFTPAGVSDMVNPFTGDFTYNIPLLEVDGYPINMAYTGNVGMDQDASWVGLGWNLNPGVINRSVRGLPDDFRGDDVVHEKNIKEELTMGGSVLGGLQVFGIEGLADILSYELGVNYNNYNGFGFEIGGSVSLSVGDKSKGAFTGNLGFTSSSNSGMTLQPSIGLTKRMHNQDNLTSSFGTNVGTSFNRRSGIKTYSMGMSLDAESAYTSKSGGEDGSGDESKPEVKVAEGSSNFSANFSTSNKVPRINSSMETATFVGAFTVGTALIGTHPNVTFKGHFSQHKLKDPIQHKAGYGYLYSEFSNNRSEDLLDFNRENENGFNGKMPMLPVAVQTYDMLSVSGQGLSGSYRPIRNSFGSVYDPTSRVSTNNASVGVEVGGGLLAHGGGNLEVVMNSGRSGKWVTENPASGILNYRSHEPNSEYEPIYFKEANEKNVSINTEDYEALGANKPVRVRLDEGVKYHTSTTDEMIDPSGNIYDVNNSFGDERARRRQVITAHTRDQVINGHGVMPLNNDITTDAKGHHISEIDVLREDGKQYVFGIPAYNTEKKEVTFSVGDGLYDNDGHVGDAETGLVQYTPGEDNSTSNEKGIDHYYQSTSTPAYAHSYLLSCVLDKDYIDSDGIKGPSEDDFGGYTLFKYMKIPDYQWRTPYQEDKAFYDRGHNSIDNDDKASYVYGKKELWYLDTIETKNYIVVFEKGNRDDGKEIIDEDGGNSVGTSLKKLERIKMFSKKDIEINSNATPIKTVHFEYNYDLCEGTPSNNSGGGKLTLEKVYFTYGNSYKAKFSPYEFSYNQDYEDHSGNDIDFDYASTNHDRWNSYKKQPNNVDWSAGSPLKTSDYPYSTQDRYLADQWASAWLINSITLPTGGKIEVKYESDDYGYVQHKNATRMFKLVSFDGNIPAEPGTPEVQDLYDQVDGSANNMMYCFRREEAGDDIEAYFEGLDLDKVYFKFLVNFSKETSPPDPNPDVEYVNGYGKVIDYGEINSQYGYVKFDNVDLNDNGGISISPVAKAALNYGRLYLSRYIYDSNDDLDITSNFGLSLLQSFVGAIGNFGDIFQSPNSQLYESLKRCRSAVTGKSWIKLNDPDREKVGGGYRVKEITISDEWDGMTSSEDKASYGKRYKYVLEDGSSSGVAQNEPAMGGEESALVTATAIEQENFLAPDNRYWLEEPFGMGLFPSPTVGYSRVVVEDIHDEPQNGSITRHGKGYVVNEYYTAREFPTFHAKTENHPDQDKTSETSISSLLNINVRDIASFSQGFVMETNDMHGKLKKKAFYQEGQTAPYKYTEHHYKTESKAWQGKSYTKTLVNNDNTVITPQGEIQEDRTLGLFFDIVSDSKEERSITNGPKIQVNAEGILLPTFPVPLPIAVPIGIPGYTYEKTKFRYITVVKTIQRFGVKEKTVKFKNGTTTETEYLAYDSESGNPVLTRTVNNFEDNYYTMNLPAYWYYDNMGLAYDNIDLTGQFEGGSELGTVGIGNSSELFTEGDEVQLDDGTRVWVADVGEDNWIRLIDENGDGFNATNMHYRIVRSGFKNNASSEMLTITSLSNPLDDFEQNQFEKVVTSTAIEYGNRWRTFCDCLGDSSTVANLETVNPFLLGTENQWHAYKEHTFLTERSQTDVEGNTNLRRDGVYTSYSPFFRRQGGHWVIDEDNWTWVQEVTEYSPEGYVLEKKDALERPSANLYGYNRTLQTTMAKNAETREIGFESFEDFDLNQCGTGHFRFDSSDTTSTVSHTGLYSLKVQSGTPSVLQREIGDCLPPSQDPCDDPDIEIETDPQSNDPSAILINGGTPPYQVHMKVLAGEPEIEASTLNKFDLSSSGASKFLIEVIDNQGCRLSTDYLNINY